MMKKMKLEVMILGVAIAVTAYAQESPADENNPLNAVVEACKDGFVCIGLDRGEEWDVKVIVDAKEMQETTARVMKRNLIPFDRNEDLRSK
jgi:hypothetical protein